MTRTIQSKCFITECSEMQTDKLSLNPTLVHGFAKYLFTPTPTLMAFTWVSKAHGPSPSLQSTACSLTQVTGYKLLQGFLFSVSCMFKVHSFPFEELTLQFSHFLRLCVAGTNERTNERTNRLRGTKTTFLTTQEFALNKNFSTKFLMQGNQVGRQEGRYVRTQRSQGL